MFFRRVPHVYSRAEYVSDAVVHVSGLILALVAAPALVALTAIRTGDFRTVTAVAVYAIALVAMLACSALYNMIRNSEWSDRLRRIDQTAIYMKIAGTYTPVLVLTGAQAGWFLIGIWTIAVTGASVILFGPHRLRYLAVAAYLALGWAGVVFWGPALSGLSEPGLVLALVAGVAYTAGVFFLICERMPFHNTIWHVFVLLGTGAAYGTVMVELFHLVPAAA